MYVKLHNRRRKEKNTSLCYGLATPSEYESDIAFSSLPATPSEHESNAKRHHLSIGFCSHLSESEKKHRFRLVWLDH